MERSLLQAEKIAASGRMAATIAHEINNPLEAVMNLLYLLRPKVSGEEGLNYLATAESELGRVSHIAKQTLGYYREHAAASMASPAQIADHALTIYEPRCTAAGITIKKSLSSSRKVVLRRGEMMQVISNLIANAIYAMPDGGTLTISVSDTTTPADGVALNIADNGEGITPDVLPKVFDAFFTTRATVGTGTVSSWRKILSKDTAAGSALKVTPSRKNTARRFASFFLSLRLTRDARLCNKRRNSRTLVCSSHGIGNI